MKRLIVYLFVWLAVLIGCTTEADRSRMRSSLDSINMLNRNGQPFTIDDVQPYVSFFDDHGTANDRLLAHYLLGLAYYDHGEAPMALKCYQDAVDCADTTDADCDYAQLARVYAQMSQVFYSQELYQEQLTYTKQSVRYAWRGGDTLAALMSYEQEAHAYKGLNHKDSAIAVIEKVSMLYDTLGYPAHAAISLGGVIRIYLDEGEYGKAKRSIERYEKESGLFSPNGDIEQGREIFYKIKGLYFLYTNKLDSAEFYFRKELRTGKDFNNQNAAARGLTLLYQRLQNPDSLAKYSMYAYALNDSIYARMTTQTVERMHAMYDYSRHQELARQEEKKASQRIVIIWICVGVILFAVLVGYELYRRSVKAYSKLDKSYQTIQKIQQWITHLEAERDHKVSEIETEKEQHDKDVASISQKYDKRIEQLRDRVDSVQREAFERIGRGRAIYRAALRNTPIRSREDEKCLIEYYSVFHYESYHKWMEEYEDLTVRYLAILILQEMGKQDSDIEQLLCVSSGALRTAKSRINAKKKS